MDWFKNNPFVGALAAGTLLLALATGYFVFHSWSRFQEETQIFEDQTATLRRLQGNQPFPNEENVKRTQEEFEDARRILEEVGREFQVTLPVITPQAFQDRLRELVNDITSRAAANDVGLGEGFFLGFEAYETQPPPPALTGQLLLELQAIHAVASVLVDAKVRAITSISRPEPPPTTGNVAEGSAAGDLPDVSLVPFDVNFTADQSAFRLAFNRLLDVTPPVFVRLVGVTNSAPSAPAKQAAETASPEGAGGIQPVLGRETLEVTLRLASVGAGPRTN